jgi:hypothetical protein
MSKTKAASKASADLSQIIGAEMYGCWVAMLKTLVPHGRTHRLSVVVAAMMSYAVSVIDPNDAEDDPLAEALLNTTETSDHEEFSELVHQAFAKLFKDAGVPFKRTSSKGAGYSILDEAFMEYVHWEDYPWD